MEDTILWMMPMHFPSRLVKIRKKNGFTQQTLSEAAGIHANQIKRYEGGTAQPTLDSLVKLAKVFRISLDELVFEKDDRGPSDDLKLQFEAVAGMSDEEKKIVKEVLESLLLRHQANRWTNTA